jgi:hypothetical protein
MAAAAPPHRTAVGPTRCAAFITSTPRRTCG